MTESFVDMLVGASNTLGRSPEVVECVKAKPERINELFELYFQPDEWVRLRASNALRRLWREDINWVKPFIARWVEEVALIEQPSVNWTFAQVAHECKELFSDEQMQQAIVHVKRYLTTSDDWIVLNASIEMLGQRAKVDAELREWVVPQLEAMVKHPKKSVAGRAVKRLTELLNEEAKD